ncbi:MAG: DUF4097 family beta strand repeat protein [Deltaproteobacteria bacterium]|nr:DUF4097 family beta strand repeat protein [Deltaproteobacteria bacterium]
MAGQENLTFTGVDKLVIDGSFFAVEVAGYPGTAVEAQIIIPSQFLRDNVKVLHEQTSSKLKFWVEKKLFSSINLPFREKPKMIFKVPHEFKVSVNNSSGKIMIQGITSQEIQLETSSGAIELKEISSDLHLTSSSGQIAMEGCNGKKNLKTSSGRITVLKSDGDIKAKTSSGKQTYEGVKGDIFAHSSSGALYITDHEGGLNLESSSGKQEGSNIRITKNSSFRTTSGKINFDFINNMNDFTFDLQSSSGKIKIDSTSAKGRVVTGNGKILIEGKSSSGGQTYR